MSSRLQRGRKYLQVALNSNLFEAKQIISQLPDDSRIILEAGTPLIKNEGIAAVSHLRSYWLSKGLGAGLVSGQAGWLAALDQDKTEQQETVMLQEALNKLGTVMPGWVKNTVLSKISQMASSTSSAPVAQVGAGSATAPYVVADIKTADLASWEVKMAKEAGASAVTCLAVAPIETIDAFIQECINQGLDSMVDMMNVQRPLLTLEKLAQPPDVVILHRGVDEEAFNSEKELPYNDIQLIKDKLDILIAVAGGDDFQEVQRAIFNDADIVVVWKSFYQPQAQTADLATKFLQEIR